MQKSERLHYLDSLRGIASLMVVLYHFFQWLWQDDDRFHVVSFLFNGSDAVSFFFVLSGFVLSFKYFRNNVNYDFKKYLGRRIYRLYPAYIFTVLGIYIHRNWGIIKNGELFTFLEGIIYNQSNILHELVMVRLEHPFYGAGWTLGVEMTLSLLVPLLVLAARQDHKVLWWFLPFTIIMGLYISKFAFHFTLGILLSYYYKDIVDKGISHFKWYPYRWALFIIAFLLFSIRHIDRLFHFGNSYHKVMQFIGIDFFHFTGIGSAFLILIVIATPSLKAILNKKWLLFLGKISYGLYLSHWFFLIKSSESWYTMIDKFPNPVIGNFSLMLIYVTLSIISAYAIYRCIEIPFIKRGRKMFP